MFAQGTVNFVNTSTTLVRTNALFYGGPAGNISSNLGGYVFALLTAPSTVTSLSPSAQELLTSTWTFTGLYATNTAATAGGRLSGGSPATTQQGWAPGATNSRAFRLRPRHARCSGPLELSPPATSGLRCMTPAGSKPGSRIVGGYHSSSVGLSHSG